MKKTHFVRLLLAAMILYSLGLGSCKKDFERLMLVKTTSVDANTYLAKGEIVDVGSGSPEYGFYYSYTPDLANPAVYKVGTTSSPKTFEASFDGLPSGTYYLAAYAKSSQGTIFGNVLKFTVSGGDVDYYWDDGTSEYSWIFNSGTVGWFGNLFPVTSTGTIISAKLMFITNTGAGSDQLTVEFFDANYNSIGSSGYFTPTASSWIFISGLSIPYSGNFYAMVHWNNTVNQTNWFAEDQNGPNVSMDLAYEHYGSVWERVSSNTAGNMLPGIFLLRVTAQIAGKDKKPVITELGPPVTPAIPLTGINRNTGNTIPCKSMPVSK